MENDDNNSNQEEQNSNSAEVSKQDIAAKIYPNPQDSSDTENKKVEDSENSNKKNGKGAAAICTILMACSIIPLLMVMMTLFHNGTPKNVGQGYDYSGFGDAFVIMFLVIFSPLTLGTAFPLLGISTAKKGQSFFNFCRMVAIIEIAIVVFAVIKMIAILASY